MRTFSISIVSLLAIVLCSCTNKSVFILNREPSSAKVQYGKDKIELSLAEQGYKVIQLSRPDSSKIPQIIIGSIADSLIVSSIPDSIPVIDSEGFLISTDDNITYIAGHDPSGLLYGCFELADKIKAEKNLPDHLWYTDAPQMILRGACVGLQKTNYLPGRNVYEYPYTPDNFPWFYDKQLWIRYLDMLAENRMNSVYLWNGHPFASLVKLEDYPFAVEVDEETFRKNEEMFNFLTSEAHKRGIWVIQMFYNIIVSKPFAEYLNIETQQRSRPITPEISDYTRKSIAAFIEKYPNVGLMVCLGEAMNTIEDDIEWFTKTIIPGVKDGLEVLGISNEPPIILRGHDTDANRVMEAALPLYKNLYTTHKYNGESLTTYQPRGSWEKIHQDLSRLGSVHISNVHILANLEPFRYGSPDFIQKSVIAMHDIQGANGLHLYPQTSYWDWPYTADKSNPRILQIDRDWIWYKAWGRYAWNCRRDRENEIEYWSGQLREFYDCSQKADQILLAYEEMGEIAPKLLRRFGISDGNRQTLMLGMFMSQLINPDKWRVYSNFYSSNGPEGEILIDWAEKEWRQIPHQGETPPQIIEEVIAHGAKAVGAINAAAPFVEENVEEFARLKNDVYCYNAFANFFAEKVMAAMLVLRYKYSGNIKDLELAIPHLEKSVEHYTKLTQLTQDAYLYANSMQTRQRRIPIDGTDGNFKTWAELLPKYEEELQKFKNNVERLKTSEGIVSARTRHVLRSVDVEILSEGISRYPLRKNQKVYLDEDYRISDILKELKDLQAIGLSFEKQQAQGTKLKFKNEVPVKLVVGYFNGHSYKILQPPSLETDASANNQGQADIRIANAIEVPGLYPVNIYTYYFEPGTHSFEPGKGIALILGFMDGQQEIETFDAGIGSGAEKTVDWLFY